MLEVLTYAVRGQRDTDYSVRVRMHIIGPFFVHVTIIVRGVLVTYECCDLRIQRIIIFYFVFSGIMIFWAMCSCTSACGGLRNLFYMFKFEHVQDLLSVVDGRYSYFLLGQWLYAKLIGFISLQLFIIMIRRRGA